MRRLIWVFAVLMGRSDSSHAALFFFFFFQQTAKSESGYAHAQIHMDIRCSHGRSDSSHTSVLFSNRQQSPDKAARMRRLIWIFAVLMGVLTALSLW